VQEDVLSVASRYVKAGGCLCYATCSVLAAENMDQIERFLENSQGFSLQQSRLFTPIDVGDGFFVARMILGG